MVQLENAPLTLAQLCQLPEGTPVWRERFSKGGALLHATWELLIGSLEDDGTTETIMTRGLLDFQSYSPESVYYLQRHHRMEDQRVIEVFDTTIKAWREKPFAMLKAGDCFRIFDSGRQYVDPRTEQSTWVARSDPHRVEGGLWMIQTI